MANVDLDGAAAATSACIGYMSGWGTGTIEDMTPSEGNLVLNDGAPTGSYTEAAEDTGEETDWVIDCMVELDANPDGAGGIIDHAIEIRTAPSSGLYTDWHPFSAGLYYCEYYQMRVRVWGDPAVDVRPMITRFIPHHARALTEPVWYGLEAEQNDPPAQPDLGAAYLVGSVPTGAWIGYGGKRAMCVDPTGPTWRFTAPVDGQKAYTKTDDTLAIYNGSAWETCDPRKQYRPSVHRHGDGYNAASGAWVWTNDNAQDGCGYIETASGGSLNGDYLEFKMGLAEGAYTVVVKTLDGPNCGILDLLVDGVSAGTWDTYAVAPTRNSRHTTAGMFTVTAAGTKTIKLLTNGQNPASGGFDMYISWFEVFPQ